MAFSSNRLGESVTQRPTGSAVLRAEGLRVGFPTRSGRIEVLSEVSFALARGTWTTCLGPSGCGKTTLLRVLAGLLDPNEGAVAIGPALGDRREAIAYLPQRDTLLPWRTALSNAVLAAELGGHSRSGARAEARDLFARFGLSDAQERHPNQLSGGMRQRVAVIRTYLAHREILLLDEPLGALDPLTRTSLQGWLLDVWRELGKTVLLVTHDVEEALVLSDRVLVLSPAPARIRAEVAPELPRPRSRTDLRFVEQRERLLELLTERAL